jgi:hypothetical protein
MSIIVNSIADLKTELYKFGSNLKIGVLLISRLWMKDSTILNTSYVLYKAKELCDVTVVIPGFIKTDEVDNFSKNHINCDILYLNPQDHDLIFDAATVRTTYQNTDKLHDINNLNTIYKNYSISPNDWKLTYLTSLYNDIFSLKRDGDTLYSICSLILAPNRLPNNKDFPIFNTIDNIIISDLYDRNGKNDEDLNFLKETEGILPSPLVRSNITPANFPDLVSLLETVTFNSDMHFKLLKFSEDNDKMYEEVTYDDFVNNKVLVSLTSDVNTKHYIIPLNFTSRDIMKYPSHEITKDIFSSEFDNLVKPKLDELFGRNFNEVDPKNVIPPEGYTTVPPTFKTKSYIEEIIDYIQDLHTQKFDSQGYNHKGIL